LLEENALAYLASASVTTKKMGFCNNAARLPDSPIALFEPNVEDMSAPKAKDMMLNATYLNDVTARVVDPKGGSVVIYGGVDKTEVIGLANMDAFKWRLRVTIYFKLFFWLKYAIWREKAKYALRFVEDLNDLIRIRECDKIHINDCSKFGHT
jgi:hypothetical protein